MDLSKLLDNAKQGKQQGKGKTNTPTSTASNTLVKPGLKKAESTPTLSMYTPTTAPLKPISTNKPKEPQFDYDEFINLDDEDRISSIQISLSTLGDEKLRQMEATKLSSIFLNSGIKSSDSKAILSHVVGHLVQVNDKAQARDGAYFLAAALVKSAGRLLEPFFIPFIGNLFQAHGDRSQIVRDSASSVVLQLANVIPPHAFRLIFPTLISGMIEEDWRIKVGVLLFIKAVAPRVDKQLSPLLPQLIPVMSDCVCDAKRQVMLAGLDAMNEACKMITNDDIRPLVPQLVSVIANPDESPKTLDLLLETTFVAVVDASVLALLSPTLSKTLKGRSSVLKRKAARVIDIMCRLVQDPTHVAPFEPLLLPNLDRVIDEITDAEVCEVAKAARTVLLNALKGIKTDSNGLVTDMGNLSLKEKAVAELLDPTFVKEIFSKALLSSLPPSDAPSDTQCIKYMTQICSNLVTYGTLRNPDLPEDADADICVRHAVAMTDIMEFRDSIQPYLPALFLPYFKVPKAPTEEESEEVVEDISHEVQVSRYFDRLVHNCRVSALAGVKDAQEEEVTDDTSLCNIDFSLAFGGKILLQNTHLKLGRGKKYGIMGKNGAGKTTLLTNIASGTVDGLPAHLKTIYVQHDDSSEDGGVPLVEELLKSPPVADAGATKEEAEAELRKIFFTDDMINSPRSSLSGGWKMKLLIVKAILSKANVMLLDEPTNHLDKASVAWLTSFLQNAHDITCLIVTHDTQFMDDVVTDIIHYESRKLVYYHGNLSHFVKIHPDAKYYYELSTSTMRFKFPVPERLDGINSNTRSIMKLENVNYTYPGKTVPQLTNINVRVCLGSRIAVLGANGAGKSTMIKMLVQETEPDEGSGEVWKHMNCRVAYVAQHSLHHVEQHLDVSPVDYIKWRFAGGVDRENLEKTTTKVTEEEGEAKPKRFGDVDLVVGRRKNGRTMEYECTFIGQTARDPNKYIPVEEMVERGYAKLVQQCDARVAAMAAGLDLRPLLIAEIQGHLNDFNLEAEFGTHSTIKRLSGGQKVKLVLAAAMWNKPHVIVLDEPTNYLDREALAALTQAIKEFVGGVVIISHHSDFTNAICTETWMVKDGTCFTEGEALENGVTPSSGGGGVKKSKSAPQLDKKDIDDSGGNINKAIQADVVMNPKSLEPLSKKEIRKLERLAIVAGMSVKEYASKINSKSPEWKWL